MKTFIDRLRDRTPEELRGMIQQQKNQIEIAQRDLSTIQKVLAEKEAYHASGN
jgi:hypothetical protein